MDHLLEVLRILDGALDLNKQKVVAYAQLLAGKLVEDGEKKMAERVRQAIEKSRGGALEPSTLEQLSRVPVDGESRMSLADERTYTPEDVNVFVEERIANLVEQFLLHIRSADKLVAEGVGIAPTMLMYGPPGCGKTELGKYISARIGLPLLTARIDGLISSYLGNTAKNLRALFEHVMERPCVLFLDELDAIAKLRDDQHELGELKRVVVSLLQNIDALGNNTIIIAATNHEHLLDPAIWRRFAYKLKIDKPSEEMRGKLFRGFLGDFATEGNCNILAAVAEGATGADVRQFAEDAKRTAILAGQRQIECEEIIREILHVRSENGGMSADAFAEQIRRIRGINPRLFTYRRLAKLFNVSVGKVHYVLKRKD